MTPDKSEALKVDYMIAALEVARDNKSEKQQAEFFETLQRALGEHSERFADERFVAAMTWLAIKQRAPSIYIPAIRALVLLLEKQPSMLPAAVGLMKSAAFVGNYLEQYNAFLIVRGMSPNREWFDATTGDEMEKKARASLVAIVHRGVHDSSPILQSAAKAAAAIAKGKGDKSHGQLPKTFPVQVAFAEPEKPDLQKCTAALRRLTSVLAAA